MNEPGGSKRVLVVDAVGSSASASDASALARRLASEEMTVDVAPGGLYALTLLERERPHLILARADLGDMSGAELCSMVQRDPALQGLPVVLLARHLDEKMRAEREADFDLVLLDDSPVDDLANRLRRLLRRGLRPTEEAKNRREEGARVITGSLGVLSFAELTQAFSQTGKTGRLLLDVDGDRGLVFFAEGKVRHAEYGRSRGVPAFARLFYDAEHAVDTAFRFEPMVPEAVDGMPRTIDRTAQQLLLSAAVELDENETDEIALAELRRRMAEENAGAESEPPDARE